MTDLINKQHGSLHTGLHEIAYEAVIRHVASLTPTASISIREAAGTSVKSSLSHTLTYDTRDDRIAATRGVFGRLFHELAGLRLGGDAHFYRIEAEGQLSRKFWDSGVVSRLGYIYHAPLIHHPYSMI